MSLPRLLPFPFLLTSLQSSLLPPRTRLVHDTHTAHALDNRSHLGYGKTGVMEEQSLKQSLGFSKTPVFHRRRKDAGFQCAAHAFICRHPPHTPGHIQFTHIYSSLYLLTSMSHPRISISRAIASRPSEAATCSAVFPADRLAARMSAPCASSVRNSVNDAEDAWAPVLDACLFGVEDAPPFFPSVSLSVFLSVFLSVALVFDSPTRIKRCKGVSMFSCRAFTSAPAANNSCAMAKCWQSMAGYVWMRE